MSRFEHAPQMLNALSQLFDAGLSVSGVALSDKSGVITAIVTHTGDVHWIKQESTGERADAGNCNA